MHLTLLSQWYHKHDYYYYRNFLLGWWKNAWWIVRTIIQHQLFTHCYFCFLYNVLSVYFLSEVFKLSRVPSVFSLFFRSRFYFHLCSNNNARRVRVDSVNERVKFSPESVSFSLLPSHTIVCRNKKTVLFPDHKKLYHHPRSLVMLVSSRLFPCSCIYEWENFIHLQKKVYLIHPSVHIYAYTFPL